MPKHFGGASLALAGLLALSGCVVSVEDYEKKVSEASNLRAKLEDTQLQVGDHLRAIAGLKKKIAERGLDNEELSQSLSMSRRHGQRLESRVADLRSRLASRKEENQSALKRAALLKRSRADTEKKLSAIEKKQVLLLKRLARFEDKLRLQVQIRKDLAAYFEREAREGKVGIRQEGERVMIILSSALLFSSGRVRIKTRGKRLLLKVAVSLRRYANREFQIQGHTDNIPISDRLADRWETNWELSSGRAARVLRYLVEVGNVNPLRISAAGFGEFRPLADNATREGRSRNRRIEIIIFAPGVR
ncbi:MAG: flagellar motor protein MotB [bacterium]